MTVNIGDIAGGGGTVTITFQVTINDPLLTLSAPPGAMSEWRDFDVRQEIEAIMSIPVHIQNDATAACGAELMLGRGTEYSEFLYIFVGLFAGGGVVLNGSIYPGKTGNAGALGSSGTTRKDRHIQSEQ